MIRAFWSKIVSQAKQAILLVEDDSNDVLLVQRAFRLAQFGGSIKIVSDGEEAVSYLSRQPPYENRELHPFPLLLLLDLKLPRRSGLEVLEWLRQQPELKRLLVVVLTASRESLDVKKAYDLGVNSYLVKPVLFEDLVILMNNLGTYWFKLNENPEVFNGWNS
ncbi:MAG: response regulator [Cyanobacteriota bacterium]|nr:response regulator [Cyanobacteriota bacterium]